MNEMYTMEDYRDYRNDYRDDYRGDYRDYNNRDYRNYRDEYGRNQRNYRDYRRNYRSQDEYRMILEDIAEDGMELMRAYEDAGEMATNGNEKQKLMKMADREKEHHKAIKEMLQNRM